MFLKVFGHADYMYTRYCRPWRDANQISKLIYTYIYLNCIVGFNATLDRRAAVRESFVLPYCFAREIIRFTSTILVYERIGNMVTLSEGADHKSGEHIA